MPLFKNLPSFSYVIESTKETALRFPLTIFSALIAALVGMDLIESPHIVDDKILTKILMLAFLGLPLFTALRLLADKKNYSAGLMWIYQLAGMVFLVGYYFVLPHDVMHPFLHFYRYSALSIGFHFLAAFLPFLGKDQTDAFWQYNKTLFLRFLQSALFAGVLSAGLALSLASADYLFSVPVKDIWYPQLFEFVMIVFTTLFFLSGIPKKFEEFDRPAPFPKSLKVFAQYILLPLVILYFAILILYEAKIIVTWNWPKGWVSELILWYAITGILTLLLLYPERTKSDSRWVQTAWRWYFRAMLPMVALLFLAIFKRIGDYGITINRYYVVAMALGLGFVVLYFVFSKRKDIRAIPITVFVIALLSSVGPWSAFSVSQSSQVNRLESFLEKNDILVEGIIQSSTIKISFDDRKEMSSIIDYLGKNHGVELFSRWIDTAVIKDLDTTRFYSASDDLCEMFGFEFIPKWRSIENESYFNLRSNQYQIMEINKYEKIIRLNLNGAYSKDLNSSFKDETNDVSGIIDSLNSSISIFIKNKQIGYEDTLTIKLDSLLIHNTDPDDYGQLVDRSQNTPSNEMFFTRSSKHYEIALYILTLNGNREEDQFRIEFLDGWLLFREFNNP